MAMTMTVPEDSPLDWVVEDATPSVDALATGAEAEGTEEGLDDGALTTADLGNAKVSTATPASL